MDDEPEAEELKREAEMEQVTLDVATSYVQEILDYAVACDMSEDELRELLNKYEIDGDAADIYSKGDVGYKINVWGPYNSIITVES